MKIIKKFHSFSCKDCGKIISLLDLRAPHDSEGCKNQNKMIDKILECDWIQIHTREESDEVDVSDKDKYGRKILDINI
jgi:hypothetical protein